MAAGVIIGKKRPAEPRHLRASCPSWRRSTGTDGDLETEGI